MAELSFKCQLIRQTIDPKKNCSISNYEINAEWSLVCLWSPYDQNTRMPSRPEYLEICRNSTGKEIIVSGSLQLVRNGECLLQRKFKLLFEAGSSTSLLGLEYEELPLPSLNYFVISGTLTVSPHLTHDEYVEWDEFRSLRELSSDFKLLLDQKETYFSDVSLKCGTDSFPAHKNILCARSPVFAAMFKTEMKETLENKVSITDISSQVLKTMLTYIYTGKTRELSIQYAGELLFAADMYQLRDLKRVCCNYLKSCMSVENALKTLVLGDLHDEDLKRFAIDFICDNCEEFEILEKTVEWKNFREKKPSLAMDVVISLVKFKDLKLKSR